MTIDEAIEKYETLEYENMTAAAEWYQKYLNYQDHEYKAFGRKCDKEAGKYKQLADWLKELKELREKVNCSERPNNSKQERVFKKLVKDKKDYYSIIWEEDGKEYQGYSSFSLDVISDFLKEYFLQPKQQDLTKLSQELWTKTCLITDSEGLEHQVIHTTDQEWSLRR